MFNNDSRYANCEALMRNTVYDMYVYSFILKLVSVNPNMLNWAQVFGSSGFMCCIS